MLINTYVGLVRKYTSKKTLHLDEASLPEYEINPEAQLISNEMMRHINMAISELPPQCRLSVTVRAAAASVLVCGGVRAVAAVYDRRSP